MSGLTAEDSPLALEAKLQMHWLSSLLSSLFLPYTVPVAFFWVWPVCLPAAASLTLSLLSLVSKSNLGVISQKFPIVLRSE